MIPKSKDNQSTEQTHFGYDTVDVTLKAKKVAQVFDKVANRYDLMNDLMSFGLHRLWKEFTLNQVQPRPGQKMLDLAGGTGDLAKCLAKKVGPETQVVLADINQSMLEEGRNRLINEGILNIEYVQADAQNLPFKPNYFDGITIGFGLRNVTDIMAALRSMFQVLKPGGRLFILEFSKPALPLLGPLYDLYSFSVLPALGKIVTGNAASYQYLAESIRMHPEQKKLLKMMQEVGFELCEYYNLAGGIVALHRGVKLG